MDLFGKMVQGTGCAVDGTVAAQNPLSRAMDSVLQAQNRGGATRGRQVPGPQPGYVNDMQMQMQRQNFARGADAQMLQGFEQEAMHRSRMEAAFRAGEMQQQAGPMMMNPHQQAFEAAFEESKMAARFNGPMHHRPPPPQLMHHQQRAQDAWVDDFKSLHMDDVWQSAGKSHQELAWEETKAPAMHHQHHAHNYTQQFEQTSEQIAQDSTRQAETRNASIAMAQTMAQNPDPKWQNSEFLQFMNKVGSGELEIDEEKNEVVHDNLRAEGALEGAWGDSETDIRVNRDLYESTWQNSGSTMESAFAEAAGAPQQGLEGAWGEAQSAHATAFDSAWDDSHTGEEKVFEGAWNEGDDLESIWEKAMADAQTTDPFEDAWETANDTSEYTYKADNPYLDASDNFKKGVEFFESGRLSEAILAFEAEVQQHPENSEAWRMLGECHAENDEDKSAIVCLERAVEEDPYNLSALLGLGVSNVNELNPQGALKNLKAWVQHNPKFHGLEIQLDEYSDGSLMDEVMQLMLQARAHDPSDSDVQVVLGVLYNVSKDYDAAANSFRMAAQERPNEYSLWNKLGATLANSSRSSEAIPSYHRALELKPRYARGWLNLGISHANLGNYEEATKCYLQALSLNQRAEHIWSYLRICFTCMERFDLVKIADTRDVNMFRDEFKLLDL
ncbi:Peroxisomal targeting signal 1 receptor, partial [Globisporangium splendens]